jgi:hypothetical protein
LKVLDRGAKATARDVAHRASQLIDRGAQDDARGGARCVSQVLDRGIVVPRPMSAAPL